jgi:hypothetical protein
VTLNIEKADMSVYKYTDSKVGHIDESLVNGDLAFFESILTGMLNLFITEGIDVEGWIRYYLGTNMVGIKKMRVEIKEGHTELLITPEFKIKDNAMDLINEMISKGSNTKLKGSKDEIISGDFLNHFGVSMFNALITSPSI